MRLTITGLSSQYIHYPLAPFCLKRAVEEKFPRAQVNICDININDPAEELLFRVMDTRPDVLAVCCPPDGVQTDWVNPNHEEGLETIADDLTRLTNEGRKVYLLDVTRANGGAPALMEKLCRRMPSVKLAGYSAWNTASNSLGTAVAQMMSDRLAGKVNQNFLWERLLDDLAYQGVVRGQLNDELEAAGEDLLHLHEPQKAEERLRGLMDALVSSDPVYANAPAYTIRLPWGRTFEAEVLLR